jgi:2-amino-4-hydroxy-6-hydroxymethyldihydropteridine diphosphokinase
LKNVFLSIGSNSGEREKHILSLLSDINNTAGKIISHSHLYETPPWGFNSDVLFLNMAVKIETLLSPDELLLKLQSIENTYSTTKNTHQFQNRNADIDILLYNDQIITTEQLVIPHPLFHLRSFCTIPLSDIAGNFIHPVFGKKISEFALNFCTEQPIRLYLHQQNLQF